MKVLCTQIGARQYYEVPARLSLAGQLALLVTDFWNPLGCRTGWIRSRLGTGLLRRAAERFHPDIPAGKVRVPLDASFQALAASSGTQPLGQALARLSATFARQSARWCARRDHDTLFTFCGAALEAMEREKALGNWVVLDQFDTGPELAGTLQEESRRFRHWKASYAEYPGWYYDRLKEEWRLADRILVNSEWTRRCLTGFGVETDKIVTIPLSITFDLPSGTPKRLEERKLRVLWLGRLCVGKGLAYAVEAARAVSRLPIEFTFVGHPYVDVTRIDWPTNCRLVEHVPRSAVAALYQSHDVFLFPSLSDGFGRVQLEAAMHGMPIIASERCGSVVEHNRSGFVVPVRNSEAIAGHLADLLYHPSLFEEMSLAALEGVDRFSEHRVWPMIEEVLARPVRPERQSVLCG